MSIKSAITSPKSLALLDQAVASGGNFALGVLLARWLGLDAFGQYSLIWMGVLFLLSLHQAFITQPLMALLAGKSSEAKAGYLHALTGIQTILSICVAVLAIAAYIGFKTFGFNAEWLTWLPLTGILAAIYLYQDYLKKYCFANNLAHIPLLMDMALFGFMLAFLTMSYIMGRLSLDYVLLILMVAYAISCGLGAKLMGINLQKPWKKLEIIGAFKEHYHYSFWLLGTSLVQWFSGNFFLVAAAGTLGTVALGALRMAQNLVGLCHVIFLAMENIVPTEAARQFFSNGDKAMFAYLWRVGLLGGILVGLFLAVLNLSAPWLIGWLYGADYQVFAYLVGTYAVMYCLVYLATLQRFALRSMKYTSPIFIAYTATAILSVSVAHPVVKHWGIGGVMAGLIGAQLVMVLVYGFFILKKTNNRNKVSTNLQVGDSASATKAHTLTCSPAKQMKIIHAVLGKANPDRMNGVNKVAYQLAKNQQEMGHEVTLWGIASSLEHNYPQRNFKTVLYRQLGNKFRLDKALELAVDSLTADSVVHLHGAFIPEFYWLTKRLRKRGIPYVFTPHGSLTEAAMQQGKWRKRLYFNFFEKTLVQGAKAIHLLGDMEFGYLDELANVRHKALIPNGMDLSELPNIGHCQAPQELTFGFCGRLDAYHKGLDLMLQGFALFRQKGHDARLELIGDGPDRMRLAQMADQLGIGQQVRFHGAKYGDEKYRLMARAHLFLHTSRMEGFPMAVLEAAALGLPCLTSEATNINRYIRKYEAGFPMDGPPDPVRICEAMEQAANFYEVKKLKPLGENAREMVREAFDWRQICHELVVVYGA